VFWSVVNQEVMFRHELFLTEHVMMSSDQRSSLCYSTN